MSYITPGQLTLERTLQNATFDLVATITRPGTGTDDGEGGIIPGTSTTFTSPCRLIPRRSEKGEALAASALRAGTVWNITFPALTDIRLNDRITINDLSYEVIARYAPKSRETARTVLCVER